MTDTDLPRAIEAALTDALRQLATVRFRVGRNPRKLAARERHFVDAIFRRLWLRRQALHRDGLVIEAGTEDFRAAYGRRGFNLTDTELDNALSHTRAALAQQNHVVETKQHRVHFHTEEREVTDRGYYQFGIARIEIKRDGAWRDLYRVTEPDWVRLPDVIAPSLLHKMAAQYAKYPALERDVRKVWTEVHDRRGSGLSRHALALLLGIASSVLALEVAGAIDPRVPTLSRVVRRIFKEVREANPQADTVPGFDRSGASSPQRSLPPPTPAAPAETRVALPGADVQSLVVSGSQVYIAGGAGGLFIVDVHADAAAVVSHLPIVPAQDVTLAGDIAYVAAVAGVAVIDVTNPRAPRQLTMLPTEDGGSTAVSVDAARLFVAEGRGFSIYDLTDPRAPQRLATQVGQHGVYADVAARGRTLLTASHLRQGAGGGLQSYDVADPQSPQLLATVGSTHGTPALALSGHYALVAREGAGLWIVSTEDPTDLETADLLSGPDVGLVRGVAVDGDEAFLTTDRGCTILNVSELPRVRIAARIPDATGPATRVGTRLCAVVGAAQEQQLRCAASAAAAPTAAP